MCAIPTAPCRICVGWPCWRIRIVRAECKATFLSHTRTYWLRPSDTTKYGGVAWHNGHAQYASAQREREFQRAQNTLHKLCAHYIYECCGGGAFVHGHKHASHQRVGLIFLFVWGNLSVHAHVMCSARRSRMQFCVQPHARGTCETIWFCCWGEDGSSCSSGDVWMGLAGWSAKASKLGVLLFIVKGCHISVRA